MVVLRTSLALALSAGVLAAGPAGAAAQTIEGQYIVVLKEQATGAGKDRAMRKARLRGGRVQHEYSSAINGFSAQLDQQALDEIRSDPAVDFVEQDQVVSLDTTQSNATWGLDRIDQRNLPLSTTYTYTSTGAGVKAYIIDTGIRFSHQDFGGRAVSGFDAVDGGSADDCNGHGTHVSGTVGGTTWGVAKQVTLVGVRVLGCNGSGTNSGVIAGINWVTSDHQAGQLAVANMSLGGGASTALDQAVQNSIADGVTYAVAAGNSNANACNSSPSRVGPALTVGATTTSDARASFSNFGTCVDVFAPGSGITSAWLSSNTATNTISGTSMASPHVAGAAALVVQANPAFTPAQVASAITSNATTGVVGNAGTGSPNRLLFTGTGTQQPPPPPPACAQETFTGTLSGTNDVDVQPNGTSFTAPAGTHKGCLDGPSGVDFDLYLDRWSGSSWVVVARGITSAPDETVTFNGTAGTYRWRVVSFSGSGSYKFQMTRPA